MPMPSHPCTQYTGYLEQRVEECNADIQLAHEYMKKVSLEFGSTSRLAEAAAAAVRFGVDKDEAVEKLLRLCDRLVQMEKVRGFSWEYELIPMCVSA